MEVALLNVRITVQKSSVMADGIGNHVASWEDFYSCHATLGGESRSRTEQEAAGQTADHADAAFTVRFCAALKDVTAGKYRILYGDEIYNIRSIDHRNNRRKCLKFYCEKVRR